MASEIILARKLGWLVKCHQLVKAWIGWTKKKKKLVVRISELFFFLTQKLKLVKPPIYIQKWSHCGIRSCAWSVTDLNKKKSISVSGANWMTNTFAEVSHGAQKGEAFREMIQVRWWGQCMTTTPNQKTYDFIKAVTLILTSQSLTLRRLCSYKVYRLPEILLIIIDL